MNSALGDCTARLVHVAFCGMVGIPTFDNLTVSRLTVAHVLTRYRNAGYSVSILAPGREWEILDADSSYMVSDNAGTLILSPACEECSARVEEFGWLCERCQERADAIAESEHQDAHTCDECGAFIEEGSLCAECEKRLYGAAEEQFTEDSATFESERRLA